MSLRTSLALTAFQTLRSNPFHTLMSILGLVIGIAALVGVLALGDGMERFARDQIETTTDLQMIEISAQTTELIDGVPVARTSVATFTLDDVRALSKQFSQDLQLVLTRTQATTIELPEDSIRTATRVTAVSEGFSKMMDRFEWSGDGFSEADVNEGTPRIILNTVLADRFKGADSPRDLLGTTLLLGNREVIVVGLVDMGQNPSPMALVPFGFSLSDSTSDAGPQPRLSAKARAVEDIPGITAQLEQWADNRFDGGHESIRIATNEMRVDQVQRGVRLFKIVMGFITGISVVVGGVGIMNVLMMAITERTREIGIRKATGARRRDIVFQFLVESMTISTAGCLAGLVTGLALVFTIAPIVRNLTDIPFQAGFSWGSVLVILIIAALVGILFGTYPAYRASRLNPVDAIRYE